MMSSPSTPRLDDSSQQSKQMSSRLLTMKFMQRSSAATRTASQAGTPNSEPPPKRRRIEDSPNSSSPMAPATESKSYISRFGPEAAFKIRPVLEDMISQRIAVNNARETQWILNVPLPAPEGLNEEEGEATDENEHDDWAEPHGRQNYGSFKRKKIANEKNTENDASPRGGQSRYGLNSSDDMDSEGDESEEESSDEENASRKPRQETHKAPAMDYTDERALAALDAVDLSRSSYAKSKGAFMPYGRVGSGGRFGKQGQLSTGKFTNKDRIHKNTKNKRK